MYLLVKKDGEGKTYETRVETAKDLVEHLDGMIKWTDHTLVAVIKL